MTLMTEAPIMIAAYYSEVDITEMENATKTISSLLDIQKSYHTFGITDYIVFAGMLLGCSGIGLFYAFHTKPAKGSDEATEYLMGGRQMAVFPVSMSLIASFISGITLLGTPTEVYLHGTEYVFIIVAFALSGWIGASMVIPVFYKLRISSTYEVKFYINFQKEYYIGFILDVIIYLNLRFGNAVRLYGSVLFTISLICWLPIVIYVPALAFNQVTGVNVHIVTPIVCLVCIFYTCIGGMKAVVWTDVIQTFVMIGALITIIIKSTADIGGVSEVISRNWSSGRIVLPSWEPDPTIRHSVFSLIVGGTAHALQIGLVNQNMIQRFLTLPTFKLSIRALWIYMGGIFFFIVTCGYTGLVAYATYHDCDPLTTGLAKEKDQIIPLLVMTTMGKFPGMPGLFVAGVFSAALSSLSTGLNSMAAVALQDFIKPNSAQPLSERTTKIVLRSVVLIFGLLCVCLVFVVENLGSVLMLAGSLSAIANGASFGIFLCGLTLPWINSKGVLFGGIIGTILNAVFVLGFQRAQAIGAVTYPNKVMSTEGCDYTFNVTNFHHSRTLAPPTDYIFPLFRLSYLLYTIVGGSITIIFAAIISYATGNNKIGDRDISLFSPFVQRWIKKKQTRQNQLQLVKHNKNHVT